MIEPIWISLLAGLALGSFANVCITRMPEDLSVWKPRSRCPVCKNSIRALDNIPLISFGLLRGKCRSCETRISWQYPMIEALMAILFVSNALLLKEMPDRMPIADGLAFLAIVISVIDYRYRIIPDELSLTMLGAGLLFSWVNPYLGPTGAPRLLQSLLAGLFGGTFMLALAWLGEKLFKQEALGGGDVKLVAGCGAWLGWSGLFGTLFFGSLSGALVGAALMLAGRLQRRQAIPFGPFLIGGAYLSALLPQSWIGFIFP